LQEPHKCWILLRAFALAMTVAAIAGFHNVDCLAERRLYTTVR
jgi:hypothetical protein